jgi:flagellar basal-body rod protein FlgB
METNKIFDRTISMMEMNLDLRSMKHDLTVSNIANMDTPNYKAFDLMVEEELAKAVGPTKHIAVRTTSPGHIGGRSQELQDVKPVKAKTSQFNIREDGNTVDIDKEMMKLSENNLLYNATAQIISRKLNGLRYVIQGGK